MYSVKNLHTLKGGYYSDDFWLIIYDKQALDSDPVRIVTSSRSPFKPTTAVWKVSGSMVKYIYPGSPVNHALTVLSTNPAQLVVTSFSSNSTLLKSTLTFKNIRGQSTASSKISLSSVFNGPSPPGPAPEPKSHKALYIVLALVALILVGMAGWYGYNYYVSIRKTGSDKYSEGDTNKYSVVDSI